MKISTRFSYLSQLLLSPNADPSDFPLPLPLSKTNQTKKKETTREARLRFSINLTLI